MPRKKGGLPYEVHPTPAKGKDGKNIVYVKPARGLKLDMRAVDEFCSRGGYGMREGELSRAFSVFMSAASELMSMGYRIDTTIGSFVPKLALKREITEGFRKVDTPNVQEIIADKENLEKALAKSLKGGYTTVRLFAYHAKLSHYSARKQLNEWTKGENPKLLKTRMAQQDIYTEI